MEEGEKGRPVGDGDKKGLMKSRVLQAMQIRFKRDVTERCIGLSPETEYIIIEGGCKLLRILLLFLYCFCVCIDVHYYKSTSYISFSSYVCD